jgi:hypothetical protein
VSQIVHDEILPEKSSVSCERWLRRAGLIATIPEKEVKGKALRALSVISYSREKGFQALAAVSSGSYAGNAEVRFMTTILVIAG